MNSLPESLRVFILKNHVAGLATIVEEHPWAASCFYASDEASTSLIVLGSDQTRHGIGMIARNVVAGTIAWQPKAIPTIQGIQILAIAKVLTAAESDAAYNVYCEKHPIARLKRSTVWQLLIQEIKFTDNTRIFSSKEQWFRNENHA
jgi:uncharacterized protein